MRTRDKVRVVKLFLCGWTVWTLAWWYRFSTNEIEDAIRDAMRRQEVKR